jgi:hypothetical protein
MANRLRNRRRVSEPIPGSIENPTAAQLKRFYIIARNLNDPATIGTITDEDLKFFEAIGIGGFDEAKFQTLQTELKRDRKPGDPPVNPEVVKQFIDQARFQVGSPENKDRLARLRAVEDAKNKNTAFSNAANLFLAGADLASAQKQINEYKRGLKSLVKPGGLPVLGVDPYLESAKRAAEIAPARETTAAMAARQQLGDIYRAELMQAPVAAAGQTGAFGALGQAASTRRRRGAMEMMPALEQIRAQQQQERAQLADRSAQQTAAINRSMQDAQRIAIERNLQEQQALGALGAAGRENLRTSLGELGQAGYNIYSSRRNTIPTATTESVTPSIGIQYPTASPLNVNQALRGEPVSFLKNNPVNINPRLAEPISFENPINKYAGTAAALGIPQSKIDQWGWNTWQGEAPASFRRNARLAATGVLPDQSYINRFKGGQGLTPSMDSPISEFENY